jgi:hypothetical protein
MSDLLNFGSLEVQSSVHTSINTSTVCGSERYKAPSGIEGFGITPHSLLVGLEAPV